MSQATHRRLLGQFKREVGKSGRSDWMTALLEMQRKDKAVLALVAFARDLAGTAQPPPPAPQPMPPPADKNIAALEAPALPQRPPPPRWTTEIRPGPHDLLSWEEAMRVPWLDSRAHGEG